MARHRRWAIFTFAESVSRFRYAFAEINSANAAKERSDAEQPGWAVSHEGERRPSLRRSGKELATRSPNVNAAAASHSDGDPEPVG